MLFTKNFLGFISNVIVIGALVAPATRVEYIQDLTKIREHLKHGNDVIVQTNTRITALIYKLKLCTIL